VKPKLDWISAHLTARFPTGLFCSDGSDGSLNLLRSTAVTKSERDALFFSPPKEHAFSCYWAMATGAIKGTTERSETRVQCEIEAILTCVDEGASFSEPCRIVLVNLHGCALKIYRALDVGSAVILEGLPAAPRITGRIVTSIALGKLERVFWLLGVAIDEPGNVWGISNPPQDWVGR
jgi:hypothetical protein